MSLTHLSVEPAILYLGTPVVLVSSINEDGSSCKGSLVQAKCVHQSFLVRRGPRSLGRSTSTLDS